MSQVVVTNDNLREKREKSHAEEKKIDRSGHLKRWQKPKSAVVSTVEKILGIIAFPFAMFWGLILSLLSMGLGVALVIFRVLASLLPQGSRKN